MSNNDTEFELAAWELLAETRREHQEERERLIIAVNDAIRRPLGVVPTSAEEFYRP